MPTLPTRTPSRPWIPKAPSKQPYQQHAARSPEYSTARWQKARLAQLTRQPCCALCTEQGRTTAATVADHITPVRLGGDFWDSANHQSLCRPCHQAKSRRERGATPPGPTPQNRISMQSGHISTQKVRLQPTEAHLGVGGRNPPAQRPLDRRP